MNREQLLRLLEDSFTTEWRRLTRLTDYEMNSMVEDAFLIDEMLESINSNIHKSPDIYRATRHQRYLLISLARQFAMILFVVSQEGKEVTTKTVEESQAILKNQGRCPIFPCSKTQK